MFESVPSPALNLTFAETIDRLIQSGHVQGIALFGSSKTGTPHGASDYDILLLVDDPNIHIFQLHTWIGGISADVVFVQRDLAERVLALAARCPATSPEGYVISWVQQANILYDQNTLLTRLQTKISQREWRTFGFTTAQAYDDWFWLNFDLRHIQRLAKSSDSIHLMTADVRVMACVSQVCRVYFRLRGLAWTGEKNALRHLQENDQPYFHLLNAYLSAAERAEKVALCEQLVSQTLEPVGGLWRPNESAVYLQAPAEQLNEIEEGMSQWNRLLKI